jgi:hypothetical protein
MYVDVEACMCVDVEAYKYVDVSRAIINHQIKKQSTPRISVEYTLGRRKSPLSENGVYTPN